MTGFRFLPPAEEEMIGESLFYQVVSRELGQDFLDDVQRVIDLLVEQPNLGRAVGRGLRRALLSRFPFSLIYATESDAILIVAVAHQKRRPDYWRKRSAR
jgi:plasmid stabilization system protein ParE